MLTDFDQSTFDTAPILHAAPDEAPRHPAASNDRPTKRRSGKWTHTNQHKQRYEQEVGEIVKKQRQLQLDQRQTDREPQHDQPAQLERGDHRIDGAKDADRDPYIEQAIQDAQDRQQAWDQGINPDRDNDRGFGIE
jgi:hypothetical protein